MTGGDGAAERLYFNGGGAAGLRRGYNVLCFEGPGQSGAYMAGNSLVFRYSMGGYFVPRAAAFDKRIAACVADCLLVDAYTPMVATMEIEELITAGAPVRADQLTQKQRYSVEEGMPRFGFKNGIGEIPAWGEMLKKMNLSGLETRSPARCSTCRRRERERSCTTTPVHSPTRCRIRLTASFSPPRTRELRCTASEATPASCTRSRSTGSTRS